MCQSRLGALEADIVGGPAPFLDRGIDGAAIGPELAGQQAKKALATGGIEAEIGTTEVGGAGARRDLAARRLEARVDLLAK